MHACWQQGLASSLCIDHTPLVLEQTEVPVISLPVLGSGGAKKYEGAAVEHGQRHHD